MTRKYRKYTRELLEPIIKSSASIRQCLQQLGLQYTGGNYSHLKKKIELFNLDVSHFTGQAHRKGKPAQNKTPIEFYLSNQASITSHKLRIKLIKAGYFKKKCCRCNLTEWEGYPIPLELHHKDRNHENNQLENLSILCPNCHSIVHNR